MKIIFSSQSDKCNRGKKAEGEEEHVQEFPESSLAPPIICAIKAFSRTLHMQKEKRSEVQSPHNTTHTKAKASSDSSMYHGMRMEGYHIIEMNYPILCLYFKPPNFIFQV